MEKISLIVPVYNVEKYLSECIESILNQSYVNLEIIIVNDGSTDGSPQICEKYSNSDDRVIYVTQKNGGLSNARNTGLRYATGDYIGFIDSDDYIHPRMYELLYNTLIATQSDIVECGVEEVTKSKQLHESYNGSGQIYSMDGSEALKHQMKGDEIYSPIFAVWSKLFKREIIDKLEFPDGMIHEDHLYDAQAFIKCKKYTFLNYKLYFHRNRENSITTAGFSKRDLDKLKLINLRTSFLEECGHNDLAFESKKQYWIIALLYFQETYKNNNDDINGELKKELTSNKQVIKSLEFDKKRKLDFNLFYFKPVFYVIWFRIKRNILNQKNKMH